MNNTEKVLEGLERIASEHFDYWTEYKGKKTKVINLDAREAVKGLIHQAIAEDRERVSKLSRYELGGYPEEGYYMEESYDGEYVKFADLLSSLDKPDKVCENNCPDFNGMSILHLEQCACSCHPVLAKG